MRQRTFYTTPTVHYVDNDYIWDQGAGLPVVLQDVRDPSNASPTTTTYLYGLDLIAQTDGSGATSFYMSDGLGSTTHLRDASGNELNTYSYDVWGAIRSSTGSAANQFDFAGEQTDHNANRGLQYLRARFYDPALGRFLSRDPLSTVPTWSGSTYGYANSDPVNLSDATGLEPEDGDPIPVPLPIPTEQDALDRCQKGVEYCLDVDARDMQRRRGGPLRAYEDACWESFRVCAGRATAGDPYAYFDFDAARRKMRLLTALPRSELSVWEQLMGFFRGLRSPGLPNTGSGAYLGSGSKESRVVCEG